MSSVRKKPRLSKKPTKSSPDKSGKQDKRRQVLSDQEQAKQIGGWLQSEIESDLRIISNRRFLTREDVRLATGVGNFKKWQEEYESNYLQTSPASSDEVDKAYVEGGRPRLKKVSTEAIANVKRGNSGGNSKKK